MWLEAFSNLCNAPEQPRCRSCGGSGKDLLGQSCSCSAGEHLVVSYLSRNDDFEAAPPSNSFRAGAARPQPLGDSEDTHGCTLQVSILSARGLRDAEWLNAGEADPYCTCQIARRPSVKLQTPVMGSTVSPEWDYHGEISGFRPGEMLVFRVYDKASGGSGTTKSGNTGLSFFPKSGGSGTPKSGAGTQRDDHLGTASLDSKYILLKEGFTGELPLMNAGRGVEAFIKVTVYQRP